MNQGRPGSAERVIDASANRAREGLRVAEDFARLMAGDEALSRALRDARHRVTSLVSSLGPAHAFLNDRDTEGDVGTSAATAEPGTRADVDEIVCSAFKRAGESLRTLAEFAKLMRPEVACELERLRYEVYDLEKRAALPARARAMVERARLCVLVTGEVASMPPLAAARAAVEGGADCIQLREKHMPDGELVELARRMREVTAERGALLVLNDRPDVAHLAGADGVHLGQQDMTLPDARRIVGPAAIVGRSTHCVDEALAAEAEGATYLGVGPVHATTTKGLAEGRGTECVREAAARVGIPWFAIGGITRANLQTVIDAGARRVAVCAGVIAAGDIAAEARFFKNALDAAGAASAPSEPSSSSGGMT